MLFKKYTITLIRKSFGKNTKYSMTRHSVTRAEKIKAQVNTYLKQITYSDLISHEEAFELLKMELIKEHQKIIDNNMKEIEIIKSLNFNDLNNDNK